MSSVREKNAVKIWLIHKAIHPYWEREEPPKKKRAKIYRFYTTIRSFVSRITNKIMQKNRNEMHYNRSTDLNKERSHNRHLTRDN